MRARELCECSERPGACVLCSGFGSVDGIDCDQCQASGVCVLCPGNGLEAP